MPIQVTCSSCKSSFNAPDNAGGKRAKCPKCGSAIQIPAAQVQEEILDAEEDTRAPFTDEDFEVEPPAALPAADDRKPCPMCGEMIQKDAVKCRYCGEVFDPVLRKKEAKSAGGVDDDMSTGDWVVAIICSGIGCIAGIIWMIQGKPKGKKMFLVSILMVVVWNVISALIQAISQNAP